MDPLDDSHRSSIWVCEADGRRDVVAPVKSHGAKALIFISLKKVGATNILSKMDFPGVVLANKEGSDLISYLISGSNPSASIIFNGTVLGVSSVPAMAWLFSRGSSQATSG
ncbi:hypothetical protein ZIOFF_009024 [Zingiber officinale]|uniref:Uncharacterized protein n=2 Tax=Zingiber officinale TaxID=94328 RepID=A0A8J5LVS6_ZINOF|nr:hypothetical protein ZIOFF_009024 [Zingiber officinale]